MIHGHHYQHQSLLYLGVVRWCHQELSEYIGLGFAFHRLLCSSHWWILLLSALLVKPSGTFVVSGTFYSHTVWPRALLLKQLYLFFISCTRSKMCSCTRRGSYLCLVVTPCQCGTLLLTCFLSPLLVTSLSRTETSRAERKFSWRSRGTKYDTCRVCFASEEGCMGSWDAVARRLRASCFFSPHPPGFTDVQKLMSLEVWSQQVGCYCIWKPSTFGSSALTSKIKRIPLFQQLSWLFAYFSVRRVLGMVSWGDDIMLRGS